MDRKAKGDAQQALLSQIEGNVEQRDKYLGRLGGFDLRVVAIAVGRLARAVDRKLTAEEAQTIRELLEEEEKARQAAIEGNVKTEEGKDGGKK